jgi:hypothetical protein
MKVLAFVVVVVVVVGLGVAMWVTWADGDGP